MFSTVQTEGQIVISEIMAELEVEGAAGPGSEEEAVCVNCGEGTRGAKCELCRQGRFRGSSTLSLPCRACYCNLHGDRCDPVTGGDCNCRNHTVTEQGICSARRTEGGEEECWHNQCGKCQEKYVGDPTGGHQCYNCRSQSHL